MQTKILLTTLLLIIVVATSGKRKPETFTQEYYGIKNKGTSITVTFEKGKEHNHPLYAIWLTDENGKFIQTLYVSESIGRGIFKHVSRKSGRWMSGEIQRPASLPYWAHQRGIRNEQGSYLPTPKQPEVDAYTGATPQTSFIMHLITEKPLKGKYRIMLELNQSWDWNEFWTNDRFPTDKEYNTSSQPALVYSTKIDTESPVSEYEMTPVGHSHYSGQDGSLTNDLNSMSTALKIAKRIIVNLR